MATGYVDPDGDITTQWTPTPAGTHYTTVDDGTRQPIAPDTTNYVSAGNGQTLTDEFNMTTFAVASISQIKIWAYGGMPIVQQQTTGNIYVAGAWQTAQNFAFGTPVSPSWSSLTFNGSWTQADLDALQVRIYRIGVNVNPTTIYALYCEITYVEAFIPKVILI